jgi:hypothetical protein
LLEQRGFKAVSLRNHPRMPFFLGMSEAPADGPGFGKHRLSAKGVEKNPTILPSTLKSSIPQEPFVWTSH